MYRIDHPTAAVALPAPGAAGVAGYFTAGNPKIGLPATVVTSDWANALQEEMINCLVQAGLVPDKQDNTQLWEAIQVAVGAAGGVPDASTTVKGKVELATTAETTTGTDTTRAVTPAGVAAAVAAGTGVPDATDSVKGKVELATNAETLTGTDATRAVTPAGLEAKLATVVATVPDASTTVKGKVELATTSEASTGSDTTRAVTAAGVAAAVASQVPAASATVAGRVELATTAEAQAGADTVRAVTPAGVAAAIANATVPAASATVAGRVELATSAEVQAGTDTARAVTPAGAAASYAKIGGQAFTGGISAPSVTSPSLTATTSCSSPYFNRTSARRYKQDIAALDPRRAHELMRLIQIVGYTLTADGTDHVGVLAEQLLETPLAFVVQVNAQGQAESVDYDSLFAIALAAQLYDDARLTVIEQRLDALAGVA